MHQQPFIRTHHEPVRLTRREKQTWYRLAADWSNREIAAAFGVSENTIRKHRAALLAKLGVHSSAGAVGRLYELDPRCVDVVAALRREAQAARYDVPLAA
jgi:DNA-binding CsgD family transcriptional regulator